MGPIGVKKHLAPFLPSHPVVIIFVLCDITYHITEKIMFNFVLHFFFVINDLLHTKRFPLVAFLPLTKDNQLVPFQQHHGAQL